MLELKDRSAFPGPADVTHIGKDGKKYTSTETRGGMTYRMWLIGMVASGNTQYDAYAAGNWARQIVAHADALIEEMQKDTGKSSST